VQCLGFEVFILESSGFLCCS